MPAGIHTTRTWFKANAMVLHKVFEKARMEAPALYEELFNVIPPDSKRPFLTVLPYVGLGQYEQKPEGMPPAFDNLTEGIPTTVNFYTFALAYKITEEANLEDEYNLAGRLPRMLARAERLTKEHLFWNILNFAFSSLVPLSDGQPLCSTTHPLGGGTVAQYGTYSNSLGAVSLVPEALSQAYILMSTLLDDRGLESYRTARKLVAPPNLWRQAEECIGSPYWPYSSENRKNAVHESVEPMIVRYLTNSLSWFVTADKGDIEGDTHSMSVSFKWQSRQRPWIDEGTGNINHRGSFRAAWGTFDGRGVVGSIGA